MQESRQTLVKDLQLDLKNFRTVPQEDEISAVKAMISISPDKFWALMNSILDDGYLPENIIVLAETKTRLIVKEGNRRIAVLKIIYGILRQEEFNIPSNISGKIARITSDWKKENKSVPTTIYPKTEAARVDKIVALTHGKGEQAGRDQWKSVATARHNRDMSGIAEPALDLLEKYLLKGKNITAQQKERWAGDYHLTVLDEALKKHISVRLGYANVNELISKYPQIKYRDEIEEVIREIGLGEITFTSMRSAKDIFAAYGIPVLITNNSSASAASVNSNPSNNNTQNSTTTSSNSSRTQSAAAATVSTQSSSTGRSKAYAINDPRTVKSILKKFNPSGTNRQKVTSLKEEAWKLDLNKNPIAFCFLLRSMFEISAKEYCNEQKIPTKITKTNRNGVKQTNDLTLLEMLKEVIKNLTQGNKDKAMLKVLHGAITELGRPDGILSVTSMNQLVHNPNFSIATSDVSIRFGNVYPLLEFMN